MINGVSSTTYTAATPNTTTAAKTSEVESKVDDTAVVYEKSSSTKDSKKSNSAIIAKLQADSDARLSSLKSLVEKVITKQGNTYASANSSDIMNNSAFWNAIRTGNFTVDAATAAQAQADIAEDGYWGVNQTSDRLVEFAKAAAGGDSSKIEKMRSAIQKGFEAAKKLWGGELPGISQDTYDATMKKLDQWAEEAGVATE
ncbi:MAG: hypothetical protein NC089_03160 [Bacteroides sp.]|nr:hypothetical protein [Bacteroides sp.]MCM1549507.1 hypothetical protein [Clostridium sp.]